MENELRKLLKIDKIQDFCRECNSSSLSDYNDSINSLAALTDNICKQINASCNVKKPPLKPARKSKRRITVIKTGIRRSGSFTRKMAEKSSLRRQSERKSLKRISQLELDEIQKSDEAGGNTVEPLNVVSTRSITTAKNNINVAPDIIVQYTSDKIPHCVNDTDNKMSKLDEVIPHKNPVERKSCKRSSPTEAAVVRRSKRLMSKLSVQSIATLPESDCTFPMQGDEIAHSTLVSVSSATDKLQTAIKQQQPPIKIIAKSVLNDKSNARKFAKPPLTKPFKSVNRFQFKPTSIPQRKINLSYTTAKRLFTNKNSGTEKLKKIESAKNSKSSQITENCNVYDIEDLTENDSMYDEKKPIPEWAQGNALDGTVKLQERMNLEYFYGKSGNKSVPNVREMFPRNN